MPQPARLLRSATAPVWARRTEGFMLPAVVMLLVVGAAFVITAWSDAEDATSTSERRDEVRAERVAGSVARVLDQRTDRLRTWVDANPDLLAPGRVPELEAELATKPDDGDTGPDLAWLVVRADGSLVAVGEAVPGRVAAKGVADDLRTLGRRIATRGTRGVTGRLRFGDDAVFAVGIPATAPNGARLAIMDVVSVDRSAIGAFLESADGDVDELSLLDPRGRRIAGAPSFASEDRVTREVGDTGWTVQFAREAQAELIPRWTYPLFAALLVVFAAAYALQEHHRRRLHRVGEQRARQVQALYQLAERVLHARTIDEQAGDLVDSVVQLVDVDGARVDVTVVGEAVSRERGMFDATTHALRVPIAGPHQPLGALAVTRASYAFDAEERWLVQTAATLVGAAMHTREALETERRATGELQRLDELRSNLLATVAHELLSPLTAVKGVLGLLSMQRDLSAKAAQYVEVATERTDRLVDLIRDLFDCSLLETGQLDIRPRRQRADELLEAALGAQAAARAGELRLSATPNLMITVDPVRFDQLVNNLVTNAFRHGAPPIEVAVRPADGGAVVVVTDEGPGIAREDRPSIFGKFWQASTGHARAHEGAGLGLSLVQGLVRVHGGDIEIDSTHADGRGARFTAYFPADAGGAALVEDDGAFGGREPRAAAPR